jgi:hypothetical protein
LVDNFNFPTVMMWNIMADFFAQLGVVTLDPMPSRPAMLEALRDQINNPLYFNCALDQQHVDTLRALGRKLLPVSGSAGGSAASWRADAADRRAPASPHHAEAIHCRRPSPPTAADRSILAAPDGTVPGASVDG